MKVVDGRSLRYQHRRPELLRAALDYVLAHGMSGLTLRPMAKELGVTIATLIRHFESKDRLIREVVGELKREQEAELAAPEMAKLSGQEILMRLWKRWSDPRAGRSFALLFELYGLAMTDPERYRWFLDTVVSDWIGLIEQAFVQGGFPRAEASTRATLVLALVRGLRLDLAATQDRRRIDRAFARGVQLLSA